MTTTTLTTSNQKAQKGFTLIELLIVIAVLGVLAAVILVALDPAEQFNRSRDAGRKSTMDQVKNAVQAYFTARNGSYPLVSGTWVTTDLVASGEIAKLPVDPDGMTCAVPSIGDDNAQEGNLCASVDSTGKMAIVYTKLESKAEKSKCGSGATAFFGWSSVDNKAGVVCSSTGNAYPDVNGSGGVNSGTSLYTFTGYN